MTDRLHGVSPDTNPTIRKIEEMMNNLSHNIQSSVNDGIVQAFTAQRGTNSGELTTSTLHSDRDRYDPHPSLLEDLQTFLSDKNATFKTPEQAEALEVSKNKMEHLLLIGPTAMGKSLVYMLPAAIYDHELVTVVLLPLSSLHVEFMRRCQQFNIPSSRWHPPPAEPPQTTIVFVSPEHAQMQAFLDYAISLSLKKKLARIVIDEFHLILQHADFRHCFSNLKPLITAGMFPFLTV